MEEYPFPWLARRDSTQIHGMGDCGHDAGDPSGVVASRRRPGGNPAGSALAPWIKSGASASALVDAQAPVSSTGCGEGLDVASKREDGNTRRKESQAAQVRAQPQGDRTKTIRKVATATDEQSTKSIIEILRAADATAANRERLQAARTQNWFILRGGRRHGPFDFATLAEAVKKGVITAETLMWRRCWKRWHPAGQILKLTKSQHEEKAEPPEEAERQEDEVRSVRSRLIEAASPTPSLTPDGRLDAGPNPVYDVPAVDNDLPTLPLRQQNLIKTIQAGLPRQTPAQLRVSLSNYTEELKVRGMRPILGLLNDMAAIIEADVGAPNARREWLEPGMLEAFERFADNHALFAKHFPLDQQREELYQTTLVDEDQASGQALSGPFEDVAKATLDANRAGLTTDDFLKIVDKLTEFAKITSTQPPLAISVSQQGAEDNSTHVQVTPKRGFCYLHLDFLSASTTFWLRPRHLQVR
jgi:GYF domain 2